MLKKLVAIKEQITSTPDKKSEDEKKLFQTYYESGVEDSKKALGNPDIFETCLNDIFQKYKERIRKTTKEQDTLKSPHQRKLLEQEKELNKYETALEIQEKEKNNIENKIKQINNDIAQVKIEPEKYGIDNVDKKPKAQFYIGLLILIPITIYLVVFYMSASFSAFFKTFNSDEWQAAIFDANAFMKAVNAGTLEVIFVCTIPFAFMGLGYLIHMLQKDKKTGKFKIALLFIVAFIFDVILAYQIEYKIYDFNKTPSSPEFNFQIAIQEPEFWGIIFAGFVVYIIWGLVLDFVMVEYENMDKLNVYIRKLKEDRENLKSEQNKINENINKLKMKIADTQGKIKEIKGVLDGFIFPKKKYLMYYAEYSKGWYMAIQQEIPKVQSEKEELIRACKERAQKHLEKNDLLQSAENIIFTKS